MVMDNVKRSIDLFREGYNCAQAVAVAFHKECGLTLDQASNISAPFGGGLGRQREICGAVSGMSMVLGMLHPFALEDKREAKKEIYELTKQKCDTFKESMGSIVCREILGERAGKASSTPEERTEYYYATRPCERCVERAAALVQEYINEAL